MITDESVTDNMVSKAEDKEELVEESEEQASQGESIELKEPDDGPSDEEPAPAPVRSFNVNAFPPSEQDEGGVDSDTDAQSSKGSDTEDLLASEEDDDDDDDDDLRRGGMYGRHSIFNAFYDPLPVHRYVNLLGSESGQGRKLKREGESGDSPPAKSRKVSDDQDSEEDEMDLMEPGVRLCYAVEEGNMKGVCAITSAANGDPSFLSTRLDPWERTPLMLACRNGNSEIVDHLLGCGASVTEVDGLSGATPLHLCFSDARAPHLASANILLSKGSNVDCRNVKQSTPLMWAAMNSSNAWRPDSMAPVRFLVEEAKADLTLKNVNGLTARDIAVKHNWVECAEYLANQEEGQEGAPAGPAAAGQANEEGSAEGPPPVASEPPPPMA